MGFLATSVSPKANQSQTPCSCRSSARGHRDMLVLCVVICQKHQWEPVVNLRQVRLQKRQRGSSVFEGVWRSSEKTPVKFAVQRSICIGRQTPPYHKVNRWGQNTRTNGMAPSIFGESLRGNRIGATGPRVSEREICL